MVKSLYEKFGKKNRVKVLSTEITKTQKNAEILFVVNKSMKFALQFLQEKLEDIEKKIEKFYKSENELFNLKLNILLCGNETPSLLYEDFQDESKFLLNRLKKLKKEDVDGEENLFEALLFVVDKVKWNKRFSKILFIFSSGKISPIVKGKKQNSLENFNFVKKRLMDEDVMGFIIGPEALTLRLLGSIDGFDYFVVESMDDFDSLKVVEKFIIEKLKKGLEKFLKF
jgi:hypothetical protein